MSKAKPCPKPIGLDTCGRPKMKGKQSCTWHWLLRQSSDVQASYARARLEAHERSGAETVARMPKSEWPDGTRWCAGCQCFVPLFYVSGSRCKACVSSAAHASRLEKVYDITAEEYERIHKLQGRRCAICRNKSRTIRLATDHDHKTGAVRGLLCKRCNHDLLGAGHDSVEMLWRALGYLLFPPAQTGSLTPPSPGAVVGALRAQLDANETEARAKLPEPEVPPF